MSRGPYLMADGRTLDSKACEFRCPNCGARCDVAEGGGDLALVHDDPPCPKFVELEPGDLLAWRNRLDLAAAVATDKPS